MGYEHDIFVSYRRDPLVRNWAHKILVPGLREWLPHMGTHAVQIFLDEEGLEVGRPWPEGLERALRGSRTLLPVLSPDYFKSTWCMAELRSMQARERLTGRSLVYPVQFSDGEWFPVDIQQLQYERLEDWNWYRTSSQAQRSKKLVDRIKHICKMLHKRIEEAPPWSEAFPVEKPRIAAEPPVTREEL